MRVDACGFGLGEAGFGALADFFWFGRIDFRRRVAFVRLLSCFRLGRRVRLGINMVSVKSCGFEAFIPARAGEPSAPANHGVRQWVYPRACGGTTLLGLHLPLVVSLSPRVRGNPGTQRGLCHRCGSIPARAGEPTPHNVVLLDNEVYPRACGGTALRAARSSSGSGLSPRVRGNPLSGSGSDSCRGSIPARAGEPRNPCSGHVTHTVYPPHCLKSNVTELRSHKVSWQIQPRNARWLASVVGKTRRNASANLFWAFVMSALHLIDTRRGSPNGSLCKPFRAGILTAGPMAVFVGPF